MMRKIYFLLFILIGFSVYSQLESNYEYEKISRIIAPPSVDAYKLGTFGQVPVGLINGTPNVSIPLTTISTNQIAIPFSLNYSSPGIRVDELEGTVGLSWQLLGGGVITRTVRDMPDEDGDYHFPEFDIKSGLGVNNLSAYSYLNHIYDLVVDSEPDIYNFQFLGKSGQFIFDSNQNIVKLDQSNLQITRKSQSGLGYYYEITDEIGNIYEFKEIEMSLSLATSQGSGASSKVSSWFLKKITDGKTNQEILFTYEPNDYTYTATYSQHLKFFAPLDFYSNYSSTGGSYNNMPSANLSDKIPVRFVLHSKLIKEIVVSNESKLLFTYSSHIAEAPKTLDNITFKDRNNNIIDNINFTYSKTTNNRVFLTSIENTVKNQIHSFEYITPTVFPARLSMSQDLYGYYNGITTNTTLVPNYYATTYSSYIGDLYNSLAERKSNMLFNKIGLLSKIIYPTKGYSEINYEGVEEKQDYTYSQVFVPEQQSFELGSLTYIKDENGNMVSTVSSMNYQLNEQKTLYFQGYTVLSPYCSVGGNPLEHLSGFLQIKKDGISIATKKFISNTEVFEISLSAGNYEFSIVNVFFPCTKVIVNVGDTPIVPAHYAEIPSSITSITTSIGSKVASVINKDFNGLITNSTYYKYRNFFDLYPLEFRTFMATKYEINSSVHLRTSISVNSNDQNSFVGSASNYLYNEVDISYGGSNFEKGGETHFFNIEANNESSFIQGFLDNQKKSHSYNSWINTKEDEVLYFNSAKIPQKRVKYNYGERSYLNKKLFGIIANASFAGDDPGNTVVQCTGGPNGNYASTLCLNLPAGTLVGTLFPLANVEILQTEINSYNKFLQSQKTTDFLNGKELKTTTEYFYNNPTHYQLTSQKTTFPDKSISESTFQYAHEKGKADMIAANMVGIPLETTVVKKQDSLAIGKVISKSGVDYTKRIIDGKDLILRNIAYSYDIQNPSDSLTQVKYNLYDNKGNLLQYTLKPDANGNGGTPTSIIWGYNQTQPIAKIEGATYSQVSSLAQAIITASNTDASQAPNNDETAFLSLLDTFRKNLTNYQVTTYTYDPLIGVRSITPPSGIREIYKYDTANRLQSVVDIDGKILKEYKYNYKP